MKSLRGVYGTALNKVWDVVGPQILDIVKARHIPWSSIDTARFFTHGPPGEEEKGTLGPVVVWIGVKPGLVSPDTAHDASQEILALLKKNGVEDVEVEWREAVLQRLAGSPLMKKNGVEDVEVEWREAVLQRLAGSPLMEYVDTIDATHYFRRFLTALLAVPRACRRKTPKAPLRSGCTKT